MYPASGCFAKKYLLEQGSKVKLELAQDVSTTINKEGDRINFIVSDNVLDGDKILISKGAQAKGIITKLVPKSRLKKDGSFIINLVSVKAVDGQEIPLYGVIDRTGESKFYVSGSSNFVIGGLIEASVYFLTLPILFFVRGEDATLPTGYPFYARVEKDINITVEEL